jgi:phage gp36-like protein
MTYITRADIEAIYGAEFLAILVPADGTIDPIVSAAAELASGEADLYLCKRYPVPLPVVPPGLKVAIIDLACYRLASTHDRLTEEISERAKTARKLLADIAAGKAGLGTAEPDQGSGAAPGENGAASDDGAFFDSRPRNFGRERGLP